MEKTTIYDLFQELVSFIHISPDDLQAAKKSKITNKNNPEFRELLNDWVRGGYDEAPELLVQRLTGLL